MRGRRIIWTGISVAVVLTGLLVLISKPRDTESGEAPLLLYCAAGVKPPVLALAKQFEAEYGVKIQLQYGGSGTLLSNIEVSRRGDLYIAADQSYIDIAVQKKLIDETLPLAWQRPVIVVPKGNPKKILTLDDLLRPGLRIALGSPESASIGRQTKHILEKADLWAAVEKQVRQNGVFKPTVPDVANDVKLGAVDAGIIWDATVAQYSTLEAVHVPLFDAERKEISVAVLSSSVQPTVALRFARYLNSKIGNAVFAKDGFDAVDGDEWAWHPEITFYCGSVNRRAVDEIIKAFEEREGITVNTVYNGCGILTGQMRTIRQKDGSAGFPDVYMACDRYYLENVRDWFQEDVDVSDADIVIAVPKGNPKQIQGVADLGRPGMRVSVGQPDQCTIGALTRIMLEKIGVYPNVMSNVVMQTASSSMLIPTVATKSVDATIAYITDTKAEGDKVDVVRIDSPYAKAVQPFSIARSSDYKYLGRRLFLHIATAEDRFEQAGLHFRIEKKKKFNFLFALWGESGTIPSTMTQENKTRTGLSDPFFFVCMSCIGGAYVLLIVLLLLADAAYMLRGSGWHNILFQNPIVDALAKPEIRYSIVLSLISCTLAAILSVFVAVPIGWLLSRLTFKGRRLIDAILDIPIVLPPLVVGLSLLILFQFWPFTARIPGIGRSLNELIVYQVPAVILAQFAVAAAFAVRTMKATFDQINPRCEQVALTLGCSRFQSFMRVALPEAGRGMLTAFTLAWARALGEFGPLLIFAGATRNKTEVLSTTVFLELSIGDLEAAVAVSLIMVFAAVTVLVITRIWGTRDVMV